MATQKSAKFHGEVDFRRNELLAHFPDSCLQELEKYMVPVHANPGEILYELGEPPGFIHFPVTFTSALINALPTGHTVQIAVVGCEGAVGIGAVLGGGAMATRAIVQTGGEGVRIEAARVRNEFERGGALTRLLVRYTQALIAQISQTAICARHHSPEQQLCRWLLLTLDRMQSSSLEITHEMIGTILGLRRETVTETLHRLEAHRLVANRRRHLDVLDRPGLEVAACDCYGVIRDEYALLLPPAHSAAPE